LKGEIASQTKLAMTKPVKGLDNLTSGKIA
jgi:hypothetical protein